MLKTLLNLLILFGILAIASTLVLLPLVRMQKHQQKQKALKDYVRRVGRVLRSRYGKRPSYSPDEVKSMLTKWGYSTSYDCYCLALYCDRTAFDNYHQGLDRACNYFAMRQEICEYLPFSANSFDAVDVIELGDRLNHPKNHDHSDHHDTANDRFNDTSDCITSDYTESSSHYDSGCDYNDSSFD
jgi:type II secretory pathway pseudopilin PulG